MALRKFVFLNPTEGYSEEQAPTDEISLGKVTATGVGGIAFDAGNQRITAVGVPTAGTDAVNRDYVQGLVQGLDWKGSVRLATTAALPSVTAAGSGPGKTLTATANGALSVDGVAVVSPNRILVKDQPTGADNGLYVVTQAGTVGTPFILTRASDADSNAEVSSGLAVFVEEGTVNADSGYTLTTNDPVSIDVTALVFSQFTGAGTISGGAGILKTGSTLDLELDTAADAQTAGSAGGSSGLEFDVAGASGKLRVRVGATGGINRLADGLGIELDNTPNTLSSSAAGLKVTGLPSLFTLNNVATSVNVTAANLNTLTAGSNSDGGPLHQHQASEETLTTTVNVTLGNALYLSGNNTVAAGAPNVDAQSRVIGVAKSTVTSGNPVQVVRSGVVAGALSGATANTPYYLGTGGAPVQYASLVAGDRTVRLGFARNATDLEVRIHDYGKKSA